MHVHRHGVALAIVLVVASVLVVFGAFLVSQSTTGLTLVNNEHEFQRASYAAQAGLAQARFELGQNPAWGAGQGNATTTPLSNVPYNSQSDPSQDASYTVQVTNNSVGGTPLQNNLPGILIPIGVTVPPDCVYLSARGVSDQGRYLKILAQLVLINPGGDFPIAILSQGAVTFVSSDQTGVDKGSKNRAGIIAVAGPINLDQNDQVAGAVALPGANPSLLHLGPNSAVAGGIVPLPPVLPSLAPKSPVAGLPDPGSPPVNHGGVLLPGVYSDVTLGSGQTLQLTPGEYSFNNITLASGATINAGGLAATRLYFTGSCTMAAGSQFVNPSDSAANLQLVEAGTPAPCRQVVFTSYSGLPIACTIFAPDCGVTLLSDTNIQGGVVSANLTANSNSSVTYDASLAIPGTPAIEVLYTAGN